MQAERGKVLLPIARAEISRALGVPRAADESAPWLTEHMCDEECGDNTHPRDGRTALVFQ